MGSNFQNWFCEGINRIQETFHKITLSEHLCWVIFGNFMHLYTSQVEFLDEFPRFGYFWSIFHCCVGTFTYVKHLLYTWTESVTSHTSLFFSAYWLCFTGGCLFLICVRLCVSSFFCEDAYSARPLFLRHNALRGLTGLLEEAVWITPPPPPCEMRGLLIPRLWVNVLCCRGPPVYALWVWSRFVLIIRCVRFYKDGILTIQIAVFNDPQTLSGS